MMDHTRTAPADSTVMETTAKTFRRSRWWMAGLAVLLVGLVGSLVLSRVPRRAAPLAVASLEDGTLLELRSITQKFPHEFIVRPPIPSNKKFGRFIPGWTARASGAHSTVFWLSLSDPASGKVLDSARIAYCILVDEHGWSWLSQETLRSDFHGSRLNDFSGRQLNGGSQGMWAHASLHSSVLNLPVLPPLPAAEYADILQAFTFSQLPPQSARLRAYGADGKLLAEIPVNIPAIPDAVKTEEPQPLPVTQEFQGLSVTLNNLEIEHQPDILPGVRRYRIVPRFTTQWTGGGKGEWKSRPKVNIFDVLGNEHSPLFSLSPFAEGWRVDLEFPRYPDAPISEALAWVSDPFPLPGEGEVIELNQEHEVKGVRIKLLKVLGPGHHEFTVTIANETVGGQGSRNVGTGNFLTSISSGREDWSADLHAPTVFYSYFGGGEYEIHVGNPEHSVYETITPALSASNSPLFGGIARSAGPLDATPAGATQGRVTFRVVLPMRFQFQVNPRDLKLDFPVRD